MQLTASAGAEQIPPLSCFLSAVATSACATADTAELFTASFASDSKGTGAALCTEGASAAADALGDGVGRGLDSRGGVWPPLAACAAHRPSLHSLKLVNLHRHV